MTQFVMVGELPLTNIPPPTRKGDPGTTGVPRTPRRTVKPLNTVAGPSLELNVTSDTLTEAPSMTVTDGPNKA